ncbi:MAG: HhH-GPD-type base excision DNA repair protein [Ilumatobacteraceae bacterium]
MSGTLFITGDQAADELLNADGTALLIGMLLDQQVPMEWAFTGPATLQARLGHLDAARIAAMDEAAFVAVCCSKPAVHRFPASMGRRVQAMCAALTEQFEARGEGVWDGVSSGVELYARLRTLPGFGDEKTKIFIALLGKRFGVRPAGWEQAAGVFADDQPRSVADIHDEASLARVREWKKAAKAAKRDKQDRPMPA